MDVENIKNFLLQKQKANASPQTINLFINALKFFYRNIIKTNKKIDIQFAKRNKKLPVILSKIEIEKIINATKNKKHKLILALAYGAGLRVSEVVNLKVKDIDLNEFIIHLKDSKGKKDRITIFPKKTKNSHSKSINWKR